MKLNGCFLLKIVNAIISLLKKRRGGLNPLAAYKPWFAHRLIKKQLPD